ncbi:glycosyltransferase family 2 protein [Candidatus Woesearchaeota archaeon]|jgi:dolichol-phosphate mannosyltransferase|nr:glycosyltransferase family 2 protein [archaeon]MBT5740040.1 glycosyltransferase family 2 protein [Candidatus Woesearchaeota archaeon]
MEKEKRKKLSLIVPCYNEEAGLQNLYNRLFPVLQNLLLEYELELLFIDDGSNDKTNELLHLIFADLPYVKIIKHDKNKNLGGAMRTGYAISTGDFIFTLDSDCTYSPEDIPKMLKLLTEDVDIVTASPYHPEGGVDNVPEYRLLLSKTISLIYRLLTKSNIYTFTALFRVQRKKVVENVKFESNNFLATAESLIYALKKGYSVKEFPTVLHVRQYGESKIKLLSVIKSHIKFILKLLKMKLKKK